MSMPLMWAFTANARIAPSAIRKILPPMPIRALLGSRLPRGAGPRSMCDTGVYPAPESSIGQAGSMTARTLVLLRHAKAETPGGRPDFERRLTTKGQADAD